MSCPAALNSQERGWSALSEGTPLSKISIGKTKMDKELLKAIQREFLPYGARLYKKSKLKVTAENGHYAPGRFYNSLSSQWEDRKPPDSFRNLPVLSNTGYGGLLESERYYWYSSESPRSGWSSCRCCGAICWDRRQRAEHLLGHDCQRKLNRAFAFLQAQGALCAVCTSECKPAALFYGVYLCSEACRNIWKFQEHYGRTIIEFAIEEKGGSKN
jgi:hypothetical protein